MDPACIRFGIIKNGVKPMINNEVELTRTTDQKLKSRIVSLLVKDGISYLEKYEKIPFFKRHEFGGQKEICVVMVNENQKEQAFEILERVKNLAKEEE